MIDCAYWSDCGVRSGGCCALGLGKGSPSFGVCAKCDKRDAVGDPGLLAKIAAGAAGLVQATVNPAPVEVQDHRMAICRACDHYTPCLAGTRHCCGKLLSGKGADPENPGCGCVLETKVAVSRAKCPLGKW